MLGFFTKTIQRKYLGVLFATLVMVNLPMLAIYVFMMNNSLEQEFNERNEAILSTSAASLSKPLWDYDFNILPKWANTILLEESIEYVAIYDEVGDLLVQVGEGDHHEINHEELHVELKQVINYRLDGEDHQVGTLSIHFDKTVIAQSIWMVLGKSLFLLAVSIGAVFVAAIHANRSLIARPLNALMAAISATQATGKKHLVNIKSDDEIGQVSLNFNQMQELLEIESKRIRTAYERLNTLHNNTPALLYTVDEDGIIRAVSDFWLSATGYQEAEVVGRPFADFVSDETLQVYRKRTRIEDLQAGEFAEFTCQILAKDGSRMDMLIREAKDQDLIANKCSSLAVMTDITGLKQAEERLRIQAETDGLTGLLNRNGLTGSIDALLKTSLLAQEQTALLFLDMDRFKWINDNLGHRAGDDLLCTVASRLKSLAKPGEYVGRFGGDEFAIVLSGPDVRERVTALSEAIMVALNEPAHIEGRDFSVAVSIGIAFCPDHANNSADLIKAADVAMYDRKNSGRNGYTIFSPKLGQHAGKFLETEQLIKQALANDWFELHLQPIIQLDQGSISGMEALIRLRHPERGMISPIEFIPISEKTGQILDIGDKVIDLAVQHLNTFKTLPHLKDCYLAVNFSAAQFLPGLPAKLASKLMQNEIRPDKFVLEITESVLMQETENLIEIFDAIRDLGCHFALDDFGTGYSSLKYLNKFPVSILKIDRSFVLMMEQEAAMLHAPAKSQTLVQGIVAMSHALGLKVVVEGVETSEDADRLIGLGVDMGQGYYFARPQPIENYLEKDCLKAV